MKTKQSIVGLAVMGILAASLISCNFWRDDHSSPTTPASGSAEQYGQFFATRDATGVFEWNYEDEAEVFCVSFPEPGDYLLTYQTETGIWHIVLRVTKPAYTYIGLLPGNILASVKLERGTIAADAMPLLVDGDVERYATPSVPAVWWGTVFMVEAEVPMERGQGECRVIINTKALKTQQVQAKTIPHDASPPQNNLRAAGKARLRALLSNAEHGDRVQELRRKLRENRQQRRAKK